MYSLLDGLTKPSLLVKRIKDLGMDSVAVTEHGNMYSAIEFYKVAKKEGIKPIIGCEFYIAENDMRLRSLTDNRTFHITLLAQNETGYKNLCKLLTTANLEGFYYKPRIDFQLLSHHSEGLICLSGCLAGQLSQYLLANKTDEAIELAERYRKLFGDRYFIEVQRHENIPDQCEVTPRVIALAQKLKIPMVATCDSHYLLKEDAETQNVLLAIQTQSSVDDKDRLTMIDDDFSVSTIEELEKKFGDIPEALENTHKIAEMCNLEIELNKNRLPRYQLKICDSVDEELKTLALEGLKRIKKDNDESYKKRLEYELDVIAKTGFGSYLLIVQDLINWAKKNGIGVGPGRGSAAGSLLSYCLNITNIDPIKYGLLFERFMNPERVSMPDIDMDFEDRRRDEVIHYARQTYGEDFVAQIITFGTMFARTSVRDAGRAMNYDLKTCDRIAKEIPANMSIAEALESVAELKKEYKDENLKKLLDIAKSLDGTIRHASTHACGVVISDKPIVEYMPLQNSTRDDSSIVTQYEMGIINDIGLLKMDFLGLRNLTVISDAIKNIKEHYGIDFDINSIPLDDKLTFKLLQEGKTTSVFQLESGGMKKYLKQLVPTDINDITVMVSLYRPGPMELIPDYVDRKHGRTKVTYMHPRLEPILKDTYGIMIYQEQLMAACRALAGLTLSQADILRKAVGKKDAKLLHEQESKFKDGCAANGIDKSTADRFWALVEPFNRYGFNKSHAVSYAMIAYQTAYLKAHFPLEFMLAEINSDDNIDRITEVIVELKNMGIDIAPPDINESVEQFSGSGHTIRFSLASIKGASAKAAESIIQERANGPFTSLQDFVIRMRGHNFNKKAFELMAMSGAFDKYADRNTIVAAAEQLSVLLKCEDAQLMPELVLPAVPHTTIGQKLAWEKELLGLYVSDNPAKNYYEEIRRFNVVDIDKILEINSNFMNLGGVISDFKKVLTKTGKTLYFVKLYDTTGTIEVPVFKGVYDKNKDVFENNNVVVLSGRVDRIKEKNPFVCLGAKLIAKLA